MKKTKPCTACKGRKVVYNMATHDESPCVICKSTGLMGVTTSAQPAPIKNEKAALWPMVVKDMQERDKFGREKYGTPLQPMNGRDALIDAYEEVLDLSVYLKQVQEEHHFLGNDLREIRRLAHEKGDKAAVAALDIVLGAYSFLAPPK